LLHSKFLYCQIKIVWFCVRHVMHKSSNNIPDLPLNIINKMFRRNMWCVLSWNHELFFSLWSIRFHKQIVAIKILYLQFDANKLFYISKFIMHKKSVYCRTYRLQQIQKNFHKRNYIQPRTAFVIIESIGSKVFPWYYSSNKTSKSISRFKHFISSFGFKLWNLWIITSQYFASNSIE
jgi:hypothetical protein